VAYIYAMNLATRAQTAKALGVDVQTFTRKVLAGSAPKPVSGDFPTKARPKAERTPMWDLDACLKAWGRM